MLLQKEPTGIILDLRVNVGGNAAPMVSGIGPCFRFLYWAIIYCLL